MKTYYKIITIMENDKKNFIYSMSGDIELYNDLIDLVKYYDILDNDKQKHYKKHFDSWEEAKKEMHKYQKGDRISYKYRK